jgi:chromate transporter
MEHIRHNRFLSGALTAITAAVVGVVLNLAVWFGFNVLFPTGQGIDLFALILAVLAFVLMQYAKVGLLPVVAGAALLGLIYRSVF